MALAPPPAEAEGGYAALYDRHHTQAGEGCDVDFLQHPQARRKV